MIAIRRPLWIICVLLWVLAAPMASLADPGQDRTIRPEVMGSAGLPISFFDHYMVVQATSWMDRAGAYSYILTLVNVSPWAMDSIYLLDRYFPADPDVPEINHEWQPPVLAPGRAASYVIMFPDGPVEDGCHQIELTLSDGGWGAILMDCGVPGSTITWRLPLTEDMFAPAARPVLTLPEPEGPSKLGLHVTSNNSPMIMEFVREARPAVVVAVGDLGWLADVKESSPDTVTIGRMPEGEQRIDGDAIDSARAFVQEMTEIYLANPAVDYWLGWNEPPIGSPADMAWYAEFEAERTRIMAGMGFRVAVGNFSTGTPEADEFEAFLPAIEVALEYDGILALHEYSAPTMLHGVGAAIPGMDEDDEAGALLLRYRYWYRNILSERDLLIPLVITETGIDGGVLPEYGLLGWRDFAGEDLPETLSPQTVDDYLAQLAWYDNELRRDPHVIGCAIFNAGDRDGKWASFEVTDLLPSLAGIMALGEQVADTR